MTVRYEEDRQCGKATEHFLCFRLVQGVYQTKAGRTLEQEKLHPRCHRTQGCGGSQPRARSVSCSFFLPPRHHGLDPSVARVGPLRVGPLRLAPRSPAVRDPLSHPPHDRLRRLLVQPLPGRQGDPPRPPSSPPPPHGRARAPSLPSEDAVPGVRDGRAALDGPRRPAPSRGDPIHVRPMLLLRPHVARALVRVRRPGPDPDGLSPGRQAAALARAVGRRAPAVPRDGPPPGPIPAVNGVTKTQNFGKSHVPGGTYAAWAADERLAVPRPADSSGGWRRREAAGAEQPAKPEQRHQRQVEEDEREHARRVARDAHALDGHVASEGDPIFTCQLHALRCAPLPCFPPSAGPVGRRLRVGSMGPLGDRGGMWG